MSITPTPIPFRITDKYDDRYSHLGLQESEDVTLPMLMIANKDPPRSTDNFFGGWHNQQIVIRALLKHDPDNAKERLNTLLHSFATSTAKLDGENGSIRYHPDTKEFEYWTRNVRRPTQLKHPSLEAFVTHLYRVTEGKVNVVYYEEYSLATKSPSYVIIGAGRTFEDDHRVDVMSAPLHEFLHDEMLACFGEANPPIASLEELHRYMSEKSKTSPNTIYLIPIIQDRALPVHELLRVHASIAHRELDKQQRAVESGAIPDEIKRACSFEGMIIALRSARGDFIMKDKFGIHCETSFPPLEELMPLVDEKFHGLFKELVELNQWSERIVGLATENRLNKAKEKVEAAKREKDIKKNTVIDATVLLGRIDMAAQSATAKSLVGAAFNEAVVKDVLDGNPGLDPNKVIGMMKKHKLFQF